MTTVRRLAAIMVTDVARLFEWMLGRRPRNPSAAPASFGF